MFGIYAFLIGASVGSFLNVVADRVPDGRSLLRPRSFCDACERSLSSIDMVPVLSYLWLRGKCRNCKSAIPLRVFLVEAVTGESAHELTLLTVDAGPEPYDYYRLTVYREADDGKLTEVVRQDGLQPDYAGILVIGFPGNQLTPGKYLTRTEGWKNEWPADRDYDFLTEIPFRVIAGP